jgi:hypothetical protein
MNLEDRACTGMTAHAKNASTGAYRFVSGSRLANPARARKFTALLRIQDGKQRHFYCGMTFVNF